MKALSIFALALVAAGCATQSKYANDPRAAAVGPAYLDYIDQHPRDRDTQFYYPLFGVRGLTNAVESGLAASNADREIKALLTEIPPAAEGVQAITGKGWPHLEQVGKPF